MIKNACSSNEYLYNGKEQDSQTKFFEYGFRDYDSQLGRWHCVDKLAESFMNISPYAYAVNDPVNNIDVMGLRAEKKEYFERPERPYVPGMDIGSARGGGGGQDGWGYSGFVETITDYYSVGISNGEISSVKFMDSKTTLDWAWLPGNKEITFAPESRIYLLNGNGKMPYTTQGGNREACVKAVTTMLYNYYHDDNISLEATIKFAFNGDRNAASMDDMVKTIGKSNVILTHNLNRAAQSLLNGYPVVLQYMIDPVRHLYHTAIITGMDYSSLEFILNDPDGKKGIGHREFFQQNEMNMYIVTGVYDYMRKVYDELNSAPN